MVMIIIIFFFISYLSFTLTRDSWVSNNIDTHERADKISTILCVYNDRRRLFII